MYVHVEIYVGLSDRASPFRGTSIQRPGFAFGRGRHHHHHHHHHRHHHHVHHHRRHHHHRRQHSQPRHHHHHHHTLIKPFSPVALSKVVAFFVDFKAQGVGVFLVQIGSLPCSTSQTGSWGLARVRGRFTIRNLQIPRQDSTPGWCKTSQGRYQLGQLGM